MQFQQQRRRLIGGDNLFYVEKGSSGDLFDVVFKGEVAVENDSEVVDVWGGRPSGIINGEAEVVSGFGEGFGTDDYHI